MQEQVIFKNDGLIDIRAIKTFGVNVKETENPFGFFGTGLKYAIGILLRNGAKITIYCGLDRYDFALKPTEIRGEEFSIVTMNGEELAFTSKIGKNWELWMAYRELYCNTLDESGDVFTTFDLIVPEANKTIIVVRSESFADIHHKRRDFILQSEPIEVNSPVEIHGHSSKGIFYKGILVGGLQHGSHLTYNLLDKLTLTEDRTIKSIFDAEWEIVRAVKQSNNEDVVRKVITAQGGFEESFHFTYGGERPSDTFIRVVQELINHPNLNDTARLAIKEYVEKEDPTQIELTKIQEIQLEKAKKFSTSLNLFVEGEFPLIIAETLGKNILGLAKNGTIYLAQETFEMGTKMVAITLIEEYIHLKHGHLDMTRGMQNLLFNKIITLGEELAGEPL